MVERAVYQSLSIDGKVVGIETEYLMQSTGKGLVAATQIIAVIDEVAECHGVEMCAMSG